MKHLRKILFYGLGACLLLWGGVTGFFILQSQKTYQGIPSELEKLRHSFYQLLDSQTRTIEREIQDEKLGELVTQAKESRFYGKKLELILQKMIDAQGLHIATIVDPSGKTVLRGTNPSFDGDTTYFRNYDDLHPPASRLRDLIVLAANGRTLSSVELLPKAVLDQEFATTKLEDNSATRYSLSEISEMVYLDREGNPININGGTRETRGLTQLSLIPIRRGEETIAVFVGGHLLARDRKVLFAYHRLAEGGNWHPTVTLNSMRIATTIPMDQGPLKGRPAINTFVDRKTVSEMQLPLVDYYGTTVGSLLLEAPPLRLTASPQQESPLVNSPLATSAPQITKEEYSAYKKSEVPWIPLGYLLIALLLGVFTVFLAGIFGKELLLGIGNLIKRRQLLRYAKAEGVRVAQGARARELQEEFLSLQQQLNVRQDLKSVRVEEEDEEEIDVFTSRLTRQDENSI